MVKRPYSISLFGPVVRIIFFPFLILAYLPHWIYISFYSCITVVVYIVHNIIILITGHPSSGTYQYLINYLRYTNYLTLSFLGLRVGYAPFSVPPLKHASLEFDVAMPAEMNRLWALARLCTPVFCVILLPHIIIKIWYSIIQIAFIYISWIKAVFTGRYFAYYWTRIDHSLRYQNRLAIFVLGLSDTYPLFHGHPEEKTLMEIEE